MHADDGEGESVFEGDFEVFGGRVAAGGVEGDSGEGRAHFESGESGGAGGVFAVVEDERADAATGVIRVDEEGANLGGVGGGVEEEVLATGEVVSAVEGTEARPAAAGDDAIGRLLWGDGVVGAVVDEAGVHAVHDAQGGFELREGVVVDLEATDGEVDQIRECGNVGGGGGAEDERVAHSACDSGFRVIDREVYGTDGDLKKQSQGEGPIAVGSSSVYN